MDGWMNGWMGKVVNKEGWIEYMDRWMNGWEMEKEWIIESRLERWMFEWKCRVHGRWMDDQKGRMERLMDE